MKLQIVIFAVFVCQMYIYLSSLDSLIPKALPSYALSPEHRDNYKLRPRHQTLDTRQTCKFVP